jgi:predicted ribosomally synthesized peptide with SipW-like signal peptide
MKKIGLISLALVIALGGLGIGYAKWSDTVTINGSVKTGSLDLVVERVDGDYVWKCLDTGALVYDHWVYDYTIPGYVDPITPPANPLLVAYTTSAISGPDKVTISYNNLFPYKGGAWGCPPVRRGWVTSVQIHCVGTIPVHLKLTPTITGIPASWVSYCYFVYDNLGNLIECDNDLAGLEYQQLENCYTVSLGILVDVPQEASAMSKSGAIELLVEGIQWNKYNP